MLHDELRVLCALVRRPDGPRMGGAIEAARCLSREVVRQGVELELAEMAEEDGLEEGEFPAPYHLRRGYHLVPQALRRRIALLRRRELNLFMFSGMKSLIADQRYSVVHVQNLHPIWAAAEIAYRCRRSDKPCVMACHGLHEVAGGFGFMTSGIQAAGARFVITTPLRYLVRRSTLLYASSPADEPVLASLGARPEQIHLVPNGVDPAFLEPRGEEQLSAVAARYGLPRDRPLLLFVGHVRQKKGVDVLVEALPQVGGGWHAAIVGPRSAPELAEKLERRTRESGLAGSVTFTDAVPFDDLQTLYELADVFVFPSRSETFPLCVLEAMAKAKPVVATRVAGIPYQVTEETGVLVEPDDVAGLARAIRALLDAPDRRAEMGRAGKARLLREFTWERAAELAIEGYREAVARHGARRRSAA